MSASSWILRTIASLPRGLLASRLISQGSPRGVARRSVRRALPFAREGCKVLGNFPAAGKKESRDRREARRELHVWAREAVNLNRP